MRDAADVNEPIQILAPDGRALDVHIAGPETGEILLFHDGSPGTGRPSRKLLEAAGARNLRYVSVTRPGYAGSARRPGRRIADVVDDAVAVLDHLGAERCVTMGWSGGGPHVLACAALLPDRVLAGAAIASVAPYPAEGLDWLAGMGRENIAEFGAALAGSAQLQAFLEAEAPALAGATAADIADALGDLVPPVDRQALTGDYAADIADDIALSVSTGIWGWHDDDLAFVAPWGFDLDSIRTPFALWQGTEDRMVPFSHGEWLADHIPGVRAHLMKGHGHLSLAVDSLGTILDDLLALAGPRASGAA
jgi:pimeloyl-ACP methyl ester carboxylesterase